MNPFRYLKGRIRSRQAGIQKCRILDGPPVEPMTAAEFPRSIDNPSAFYERAFLDFHRHLPEALREHRAYFRQEGRGFGEDAFHAMWYRLFAEFRPSSFLEIGVFRGQVLSLISLIAKIEGNPCTVTGISPFSPAADAVSRYPEDLDYLADTQANFRHFNLPDPELIKALSTDPVAVDRIGSQTWDAIYIDGSHDYEIVKLDWEECSEAVRTGGIIVLDDSGISSSYRPPAFATPGHPGPSRLAEEIDRERFAEILQIGHNRVFQRIS